MKIRFNVKSRPISIWKFKNRTNCRFLKEHKSVKSVPSIDLTTVRHLNRHLTCRNFSIFHSSSFLLYLIPSPIGTFLELKNHNIFFKLLYRHFQSRFWKFSKFYSSMEPGNMMTGNGWSMIHDCPSMIDIRHFILESDAIWMYPPKSSTIKLIYIIDLFRIQI